MFKSSSRPVDYTARQAARVAAGIALIVGAVAIISHAFGAGDHYARLFGLIWLGALGSGGVAYVATRYLSPIRDRERLLWASFVLPAIGAALVLPLTIHLLAQIAMGNDGYRGFDEWVHMSLILTAAAHILFAVLTAQRASDLVKGEKPTSIVTIYLAAVGAGCIPFPILPSVIIALTGVPIVPLLHFMKPMIERERGTAEPIPLAFARVA